VTVFYNNELELNLLRLQAMSFKFVDQAIVNNVYLLYNDIGFFSACDVIDFYPSFIRSRVKIYCRNDVDSNFGSIDSSSWYSQQVLKLLIAKIIKSPHYVVLDGKNHFLKDTALSDFFDISGKPYLFYGNPGYMIKYYHNCTRYFQTEVNNEFKNIDEQFMTTTPFLFVTEDVLKMISYIENKEKNNFYCFFQENSSNFTEFYLYSTFLEKNNLIQGYAKSPSICISVMASPFDDWNSYEGRCLRVLKNPAIKIFGLHRKAVSVMDVEYKEKLESFYKKFYDKEMCDFIRLSILFSCII